MRTGNYPGEGWRWLNPMEPTCQGDECISRFGDEDDEWVAVGNSGIQQFGLCYRRRIDTPEPTSDPVNSPAHYTSHPSGVECICITEHMGFCLGNAIKYIWRADEKGNALEDLRKAAYYINREIAKREKAE
jgi:hypothetical protein